MPTAAEYCQYFRSQHGGNIPVFRGGQHGAGIGDFLRGLFRFIAPIALRGVSTFAGKTLDAHNKGSSLKDAAKSAIMPALSEMATGVGNTVFGRRQEGSGAKIPHKRGRQKGGFVGAVLGDIFNRGLVSRFRPPMFGGGNQTGGGVLFNGEHGVPSADAYKSRRRAEKRHRKGQTRKRQVGSGRKRPASKAKAKHTKRTKRPKRQTVHHTANF